MIFFSLYNFCPVLRASSDNSYVCDNNQIYITTEKDLKNQIRDARKSHELAQKEHFSYQELKELKELSRAVLTRAEARLKDLYPEHR